MGIAVFHKNKRTFALAALLSTILFIFLIDTRPPDIDTHFDGLLFYQKSLEKEKTEEWWNLRKDLKNLSKLGEVLFLQTSEPKISADAKRYKILVWKYGHTIENRHLKHFSGNTIDPFEYCPVSNCDITYSNSDLSSADIVIFHLHRTKGADDVPKVRNPNQIWAFLTDESPYHTFLSGKIKLKDFNGIFNWSMSYRMDSDIPVPYGRTVLKEKSDPTIEIKLEKRRDVLVAILGSNCHGQNHRWEYVRELQKHIKVDVYGGCGQLKKECPGHFGSDCPAINDYLFYLSFENSNCNEYVTEKLWWNAYAKNSIPIVMGSDIDSYKKLLPVDSYINVEDFANADALAQYLLLLNNTDEFKSFYKWKGNFDVLNEHGYFQSRSYHYCRICQALNYNSRETKVYNNLESFWSVKKDCHPAWDTWTD